MQKVINRINVVSVIISGIALAGLMILITAGVFTRYILNFSIPTAYEIVENYLMPIGVFVALGYAYSSGIFPRVDAFTEKIKSAKTKKIIDCLVIAVELIIFIFITYYLLHLTFNSIKTGMGFKTNGINFPLYPIHFLIMLGFVWKCFLIVVNLIQKLKEDTNRQTNQIVQDELKG